MPYELAKTALTTNSKSEHAAPRTSFRHRLDHHRPARPPKRHLQDLMLLETARPPNIETSGTGLPADAQHDPPFSAPYGTRMPAPPYFQGSHFPMPRRISDEKTKMEGIERLTKTADVYRFEQQLRVICSDRYPLLEPWFDWLSGRVSPPSEHDVNEKFQNCRIRG